MSAVLLLNVDDNDAGRYVKTRILRNAGFEVVEAATGAEALARLAERTPALVLLDVKLPDMSGRDIAGHIKRHAETARIVVLQTSATHVEPRHRVASLDAGADGYLVEPMEPEELVASVRALLRMRQAEDERQAALDALREADRRKDEFLAMLAHELRNPLAPIRNAVEILKSDDPAIRERARTLIGRQVDHMARLVDDLLEVSRITQRKVTLRRAVVALRSVVDAAVETARPDLERREQGLEVACEDGVWLEADPVRLSQVLGNLLHNASKFTAPGGSVRVDARRRGGGIEIVVEDNGCGIAADVLPKVFDLFAQADQPLHRGQGGLGIGLSLVRGLVDMHGGTVTAESEGSQRGSRFTVRLPGSLLRAAPQAAYRAVDEAAARRRRILVVEDNQDSAEAMLLLLGDMGHDVRVVADGLAAVESADAQQPEIIFVDIGLPGIDGYEVVRRLRASAAHRAARIVAISGYGQASDRARSEAAGFDMHLVKPVDPARLAEVIGA